MFVYVAHIEWNTSLMDQIGQRLGVERRSKGSIAYQTERSKAIASTLWVLIHCLFAKDALLSWHYTGVFLYGL